MKSPSGRGVFRFRLQTMLVIITTFAICLGLITRELHRQHRKNQDAAEIVRLGGNVRYNLSPENVPTGVVNGYLRIVLGDEYFTEADDVFLKPRVAKDFDLLRSFPEITRLGLDGAQVTGASLERLRGLSKVDHIGIYNTVIGEPGLKSLAAFSNLDVLQFEDCSLDNASVKSLTEITTLRQLYFTNCVLSDESLKFFRKTANTLVTFRDCALTDASLESLHGARTSINLGLFKTSVTEAGILALRNANPNWTVRYGSPTPVPMHPVREGYLPSIQELPHTEKLVFEGPLTSDATLAALKDAVSLTSLQLWRCPVTDSGVQSLTGLKKLRELSLIDTKVEGSGLRTLPSSITSLGVASSGVTDRGVAGIAKLKSLEALNLSHTLVTDEAIDELASMTSLRALYIRDTAITDAGVARLQRALPDCTVYTD